MDDAVEPPSSRSVVNASGAGGSALSEAAGSLPLSSRDLRDRVRHLLELSRLRP